MNQTIGLPKKNHTLHMFIVFIVSNVVLMGCHGIKPHTHVARRQHSTVHGNITWICPKPNHIPLKSNHCLQKRPPPHPGEPFTNDMHDYVHNSATKQTN